MEYIIIAIVIFVVLLILKKMLFSRSRKATKIQVTHGDKYGVKLSDKKFGE